MMYFVSDNRVLIGILYNFSKFMICIKKTGFRFNSSDAIKNTVAGFLKRIRIDTNRFLMVQLLPRNVE